MIQIENLNKVFSNNHILKDISLKVKKGAVVGIVGPNGSGKSTLLKCIYRVMKPCQGVIRLDGMNLETIKLKESAQIMSVVSQHNTSAFDFNVLEMVLMGRSPYKETLTRRTGEDYEIAHHALEMVDMLEFVSRNFSTLSGGEQQRIILARALAQQPECIILDEPTNHLDIKHQLQMMTLLKQLGITVFAAIHDLNIAMNYCDNLYVIDKGEIKAAGKTSEVLTENLMRQVFHVDSKVHNIDGKDHIIFHGPVV